MPIKRKNKALKSKLNIEYSIMNIFKIYSHILFLFVLNLKEEVGQNSSVNDKYKNMRCK